jgi:lactoylglutathione lyase
MKLARLRRFGWSASVKVRCAQGIGMKYRHTMLRISNIEESLDFYVGKVGLVEIARYEVTQGRFTLVFLTAPNDPDAQIELTYNWDPEVLTVGRNFGHISYDVDNIYETCTGLMERGVVLARPPRDGYMAFVRSPDNVSIEFLQRGKWLTPAEPWLSMPNVGTW